MQSSTPPPLPKPAPIMLRMQQGRVFRFAVPQGWNANETANGVDIASPDGVTVASHTLLRGLGHMSPEQCLKMVISYGPQVGITHVQVTGSQAVNPQTTAFELTYRFKGVAVRAVAIYGVSNNFGGYIADMITLQAPPHAFARDVQLLMHLAQSVVVTNGNAVCGNDQLIPFQPPQAASTGGSSNPVGDIIIKGEQGRNKIRDHIFQRNDDAIRGVTRWGPSGNIVVPNDAARVFMSPGGKPYYTKRYSDPPPPNTTEVTPYNG